MSEIPLLKYVDVLIGFSVVMIVSSAVIAAGAESILALLGIRTKHLHFALESALSHALTRQPATDKVAARKVARDFVNRRIKQETALSHGFLGWSKIPRTDGIEREEFIALLLEEAAAHPDKEIAKAFDFKDGDSASALLAEILARTARLEREKPKKSSANWRSQAILDVFHDKPNPFIHKLMYWFDNAVTRASARYLNAARVASWFVAAWFVGHSGLDALDLLRRLSADGAVRARRLEMAMEKVDRKGAEVLEKISASAASNDEAVKKQVESFLHEVKAASGSVDGAAISFGPNYNIADWWSKLSSPGGITAWLLLGLGSPFWNEFLKNMLGVRSAMDRKAEQQVIERETSQE